MTYKERLSKDKETMEQEVLDYNVSQAKLQAQSDLLATRRELSQLKAKSDQARSSTNYSIADIVDLAQQVEAYEKTLALAEKIVKEDFPD